MTDISKDNNGYWLERWINKDTPFNQEEPNKFLVKHLSKIDYANNDICFVPLCGSSIDMIYLKNKGFKIIGVELSEQAVIAFFNAHQIPFKQKFTANNHKCFSSEKIDIICADILSITGEDIPSSPTFWYDRGGYVALPTSIREKYAKKMVELSDENTQIFLNTTIHDGDPTQPPFSITKQELNATFQNQVNFELIEHYEIPELPPEKIKQGRSFQEYNIYIGHTLV